ncbi:two-component system sensor histidine kinase NtrB [Sphingobium cloacae]|nr:ATP-binding protein [Sphingobium cloacae]
MAMASIPPPCSQQDGPTLSELMTALPIATLVVRPDNSIADANVRAETLLNMGRAAIVDSDIARTLRMADKGAPFDIWHSNKPIAAYDVKVHIGRMAEMEVDLMIAPVTDHEGWRIVSIHSQSQARRIGRHTASGGARSAMGAAAILAHEIKNPLSGIRGAAQLIESGNDGRDCALTQLICNEVDRIAALIDRMQDFTSDRLPECQPGNIYPFLDRATEISQAGYAKSIDIIKRYDPSLPFANMNGDALVQIMLNLLKNAAEALEDVDRPWIRVETAFRHGVSVVVEGGKGSAALPIEILVVDNGAGVPDHILDHLFNPFVTGKRDGQGLGLALVDKLVRDMNGIVQYSRDREAGESTFRILLPMGAM